MDMNFKYKNGSPYVKKKLNQTYNKAVKDTAKSTATRTLILNFLALSLETLHDEFGFGDKRLNQFKDRLESKLDCINNDFVKWEDIRGNITIKEK